MIRLTKTMLAVVGLVLVWTVPDVATYGLAVIAATAIIFGPNGPESDRP